MSKGAKKQLITRNLVFSHRTLFNGFPMNIFAWQTLICMCRSFLSFSFLLSSITLNLQHYHV